MNLQDLLEHSDTTLELLKQIKIANKTGVDTIPAYLQHLSDYNHKYFLILRTRTLDEKTKKYWHPISIRHNDKLLEKAQVSFGVFGDIQQLNLTEIAEIIQKFLQLSADIELIKGKITRNILNEFEFYVHFPNLEPWLKWINDNKYRPILIKAAWHQGQKDNYQFQTNSL